MCALINFQEEVRKLLNGSIRADKFFGIPHLSNRQGEYIDSEGSLIQSFDLVNLLRKHAGGIVEVLRMCMGTQMDAKVLFDFLPPHLHYLDLSYLTISTISNVSLSFPK